MSVGESLFLDTRQRPPKKVEQQVGDRCDVIMAASTRIKG